MTLRQGMSTLMSVDYAVARGAFVMNLSPLWICDPLDCGFELLGSFFNHVLFLNAILYFQNLSQDLEGVE